MRMLRLSKKGGLVMALYMEENIISDIGFMISTSNGQPNMKIVKLNLF